MNEVGLTPFLLLSAFLFACGVTCVAVKRNAIGILMGVELILNAGNVNLIAFGRFRSGFQLDGQVFALMVVVLAAAEAAVALAIFLNFYNNHATVDVDEAKDLRG
jgi:NADH-quinone oxidoreductase subunit K